MYSSLIGQHHQERIVSKRSAGPDTVTEDTGVPEVVLELSPDQSVEVSDQ